MSHTQKILYKEVRLNVQDHLLKTRKHKFESKFFKLYWQVRYNPG